MTDEKDNPTREKTTGNVDVAATQPGGTRPAPRQDKGPTPRPDVQSGDRNDDDKGAQTRIP